MKTKTRVLSMIMTIALILSSLVIVVPVSAEDTATEISTDGNLWTAYAATSFAGGSGTAEDPYEIATAAQLAYLAKLCNDATTDDSNDGAKYSTLAYELTADIDAREHQWVAIGNVNDNTHAFQGTFNGNGFTVWTALTDITSVTETNTHFTTSGAHGVLFGRLRNATVKNLKANLSYAWDQRPTTPIGTCVGLFSWSMYDQVKIENVHLTLNVTGTVSTSAQPTGGFCGYVNAADGSMTNCSVGGTVTVTNTKQVEFSPFFAIVSGGTSTLKMTNLVNTTAITLLASGHQDFLSGLFCRPWSASNNVITVTNFIDACKITTPSSSTDYLHYGSITGKNQSAYTVVVHAEGVVSMVDFDHSFRVNGQAYNSGFANLIGSSVFTAHATNTFVVKNCFTTHPNIPDIHLQANSIYVLDADDETATLYDTGVTTATSGSDLSVDLDGVVGATFEYEVVEITDSEGNKSSGVEITIPKYLYEAFKGNGTVTVSLGDASTTEYVQNTAGDYVFTLASTEGTGSMTVVKGDNESVTLTDAWTSRATTIATSALTDSSNPYVIKTAEELAYLAVASSSYYTLNQSAAKTFANTQKYVTLGADIDLSFREWTAIGTYVAANGFGGADNRAKIVFDGNNHTISGLTITDAGTKTMTVAALFGATMSGTVIKNLTLSGSIHRTMTSTSGDCGTAMLVGFASGPTTITNVTVTADVEVATSASLPFVGGIVSTGNNVSLTDCTLYGSVTTKAVGNVMPVAGGIIGINSGFGTADGCVNYADITVAQNNSNSFAGGIIGVNIASASTSNSNEYVVKNCVNLGNITAVAEGTNTSTSSRNQRLGGVVGSTGRSGATGSLTITNCVNLGTVSVASGNTLGTSSGTGEIIGYNETILHSYLDPDATDTSGNALPYYPEFGLYVNNCYAPWTHNSYMVMSVGSYNDTNASYDVYYNGEVATGGAQVVPGSERYFEIDTFVDEDGNVIASATKGSLDLFLNMGFTMSLAYNGETVATAVSETVDGRAYEWVVASTEDEDYNADAVATLTVQKDNVTITADDATWAGLYAAESFDTQDGACNGTADTPYYITSAGELGLIARLHNDVTTRSSVQTIVVTINDTIDLAGAEWVPIGISHDYLFEGTVNGNNQIIKNLTLTADSYHYDQSFIGKVGSGFSISNLTFEAPVIGATTHLPSTIPAAAVVVGAFYGGTIDNVDIVNLDMTVDTTVDVYVGGIVGYLGNANANVLNSTVSGTINATLNCDGGKVGGIVSRSRYGKVENCINYADITVTITTSAEGKGSFGVGGIVAIALSDKLADISYITNCINEGDINVTQTVKGKYIGVAGIVGSAYGGTQSVTVDETKITVNKLGTLNITGCTNMGVITLSDLGSACAGVADILGYNIYGATTLTNNYGLNGLGEIGLDQGMEYDSDYNASDVDATLTGNVIYDVGVTTNEKAAVRISSGLDDSGLRFTSYINTELYEALVADEKVEIVEFGTLIAPTAFLQYFTMEELTALPESVSPVKVAYDLDEFFKTDDENSYFTGAINNIYSDNYELAFTAVAYITVSVDGVEHTFYADYDGEEARSRSVYDVAYDAYYDRTTEAKYGDNGYYYGTYVADGLGYSCYTNAQLEILATYIGLGQ